MIPEVCACEGLGWARGRMGDISGYRRWASGSIGRYRAGAAHDTHAADSLGPVDGQPSPQLHAHRPCAISSSSSS
eukprot:3676031-Rhodomonas_salina.3